MSDPAHVLVVANRTAATPELLGAVHARSLNGPAKFHLVVPAHPHGLHKVVDPQDIDDGPEQQLLAHALPVLTEAAGSEVTGHVGDAEPLMAIHDAVNLGHYDEIIISTLPKRLSRWLHLDLVSKARGLELPVTHVEAESAAREESQLNGELSEPV
jgi:hypothetical protein